MSQYEEIRNVFVSITLTAGTNDYSFDLHEVKFQPDEIHVAQVITMLSAGTTPHYIETNLIPGDTAVLAMFPTATTASQVSNITPFKWNRAGNPQGSYRLSVYELDGTNNTMTGTLGLYLRFLKFKKA